MINAVQLVARSIRSRIVFSGRCYHQDLFISHHVIAKQISILHYGTGILITLEPILTCSDMLSI